MGIFSFGKWPVTAAIFNERADGGWKFETDKIRRVTKKSGEEEWHRRKGNHLIPPVLYKYLSNNDIVVLKADKTGNYSRMDVDVESGVIKGVDTDVTNWIIYALNKRRKQFENPSFFARYGHFVATAAVLIGVGVMIYIGIDKLIELWSVGNIICNCA